MYTVILYKRPTISVPFFQPDSNIWQNPELIAYYQSLQLDGTLIADTIEFSEDQLIMKKTMTWQSLEKWYDYVTEFTRRFPEYSEYREMYHQTTNSQFLVKTFYNESIEMLSNGNLNAAVTIQKIDGIVCSTYVLEE